MIPLEFDDYRRLLVAQPYCVLLHDAESKDILWANPAAEAVLEFTVEELLPLKAPDMSAPRVEYRRSVGRGWLQRALDGGQAAVEWTYRTKSGREILTEAIAVRVDLADRRVIMVQFRDIEREELIRRSLTRTEGRLEAFLRSMAEGILVIDDDGSITYASRSACILFDMSPDRILDQNLVDLCTPRSQDHVVTEIATHLPGDRRVRYEVELESGRHRWHDGSFKKIDIKHDLTGHLVLFHDITDQVEQEAEHARDIQYLNYLARFNAMGDMAMAITHELAQPLSAATNFIAGTIARIDPIDHDSTFIGQGLDNARKQLDRAGQIIHSLRNYVTQLEESQQIVDLNKLVEESRYFIEIRSRAQKVDVVYELADEPVYVLCENVLTGQVLLNLCFNAIDEANDAPAGRRTVRVTVGADSESGRISVSDSGRGLSHIPADKIFQGAFTSKSTGTGIGLALSHRIITRQQGRLTARQLNPYGAEFTMSLPLHSRSAATLPDGDDRTQQRLGRKGSN